MKKRLDYGKISLEVCPMYFDKNMSVRMISKQTGYSTSCIDRAIKFARDNGMCGHKTKDQVVESKKNGMIDIYGVANSMFLESTKDKIKSTNIDRYGVENPQQCEAIRQKTEQTCLEKYGNICSVHGEEQQQKVKDTCMKRYGVERFIPIASHSSKPEFEIFDFVKSLGFNPIHSKHFGKTELDVFIPELNIGIEYNGVYWHGQTIKDKYDQQKKCEFFAKRGISFIVVWEDEYKQNKNASFEKIEKYINQRFDLDKDEYLLDFIKDNVSFLLNNGYTISSISEPNLLSNNCYDGGNIILKLESSTTIESIG